MVGDEEFRARDDETPKFFCQHADSPGNLCETPVHPGEILCGKHSLAHATNVDAFTAGLNCSTGITAELLAALKELRDSIVAHFEEYSEDLDRWDYPRMPICRAGDAIAKAEEALK